MLTLRIEITCLNQEGMTAVPNTQGATCNVMVSSAGQHHHEQAAMGTRSLICMSVQIHLQVHSKELTLRKITHTLTTPPIRRYTYVDKKVTSHAIRGEYMCL